jgi:hypothetical protein
MGLCELADRDDEFAVAFGHDIQFVLGEPSNEPTLAEEAFSTFIRAVEKRTIVHRSKWLLNVLGCDEEGRLLLREMQGLMPKPKTFEKLEPQMILWGKRHAVLDGDITWGHCHYRALAEMPVISLASFGIKPASFASVTNGVIANVVRRYSRDISKADPEFLDWIFGERILGRYRSDECPARLIEVLHEVGLLYEFDEASGLLGIQPIAPGSLPDGFASMISIND